MKFDVEFNACGLMCPLPVTRAKKHMRELSVGQVLHIITDNSNACADFPKLLKNMSEYEMADVQKDGRKYHFYIKRI
ncbi:MAG: sulfurtransferase TusA family protein [Methylococcales bacterium]|jgi:tRNA 2-thiouridine synthesizing protein A|nr:sulfurtransferase TusA family protein [Methylococcales bacterium]